LSAARTLLRSALVASAATALLLPADLALADPTPAQLQAQIDKGNNAVELVVEQYNKINGDLAATQASLAALQAKLPPLQSNLDAAHANVDEIAATAYRTVSNLRSVSVLLSAQSSGTFMDQATTLQQLTRTQQHQIDTFATAKKNVDAEKKRLNDLLAAQNAQKTALETKKAKIEGDIARLDGMQRKLEASAPKATAVPKTSNPTGGPKKTTPQKPSKGPPPPVVSGAAGKAVAYAWKQLNKRYVYATAGPNTFDCSGLTMMAWKAAGVSLPHNAAQQWSRVRHISRSQLAPGDLVFYNGLGHVGIYIGNNQIIHAPNSRTVVKISPITTDPIYGYGRP
jgi:peptidoglycan DL-endopeptidase CwlO